MGLECNDLELQGGELAEEIVVGAPPATQGGIIADGTYDAVAYRCYFDTPPNLDPEPLRVRRAYRFSSGATKLELARWYSTS